jgi:hypothetical protein
VFGNGILKKYLGLQRGKLGRGAYYTARSSFMICRGHINFSGKKLRMLQYTGIDL